MYCNHCGTTITRDSSFCPECGTPTRRHEDASNDEFKNDDIIMEETQAEAVASSEETPIAETEAPVGKKPFFTKRIVWILSVFGFLLISGIVLYQIAAKAAKPDHLVEAFWEAVDRGDSDELSKMLYPKNDDWEFTTSQAEALLTLLNEHPDQKDILRNELLSEQNYYNKEGDGTKESLSNYYATVSLTNHGKKWLFFDDYLLEISPIYLRVITNQENVILYINNEKAGENLPTDEYQVFGPYAPGKYELRAKLETDYYQLEAFETAQLFYSFHDSESVGVTFDDVKSVRVIGPLDEAVLFINGKETDIIVESQYSTIGDFPVNGELTLHLEKEYPWGTATSEEIVLDDTSIRFEDFDQTPEDDRNAIMELLNEIWEQELEAIKTGDTSGMVYAPDERKEKVQEEYEQMQEKNKDYSEAKFVTAKYWKDSFDNFSYNDKENRYEVSIEAEYTMYEPDDRRYSTFREDEYGRTTYYFHMYYDEEKQEWIYLDYERNALFLLESHEVYTYEFE
ncbi:hypothetical protein SAMN05421736_107105 [Evansella caseinilytica]|uniref:Uncharacterized protein n=1 Tax=Evansella caseinilytica TaxID=1503961 RepID=A0A1H3QYD8_9BACI|nr:zinc-ribbon domain-containing protein [Evansella caseinilytica]SDZ18360.1 hypothetical protein SAMN05421736_107105 [Evansella caseinilytica]